MAPQQTASAKPTCFVVMGFGKKTDFETGRTLDLDKSYRNMIKPAVEAAGLQCIRADEMVHSGLIDVPMYEQLLNADVVVADLSTSNKNAFYELGVRHALRPFTTIVIAEDGLKAPFDVNHVVVRQYHHMGEGIDFDEVERFRKALTEAVKEVMKDPRKGDSPVYEFIRGLNPPALAAVTNAMAEETGNKAGQSQNTDASPSKDANELTHSFLMQQVDAAQKKGDWVTAKTLLSTALQLQPTEQPKDPYLLQRLALITYKSKFPSEVEALDEACKVLWKLHPETSNDTETLGLWGAIHKRLWQLTKEQSNLDEAVRAYERGFYLRNDYYNGINYAFLLNLRASVATDPAWAITDYMQARRVRQEVLAICEKLLTDKTESNDKTANAASPHLDRENRYWVSASMAEAYVGLEKTEEANQLLEEVYQNAPASWMKETTEGQIKQLQLLLANSPLRFLRIVA